MTREEAIIELRLGPGINEDVSEKYNDAVNMAIEALKREQPDEWCTDCTEYDTEKKCCPRFNKVIRGALEREPSEDLISRAEAIEHFMRLSEDESLTPYTQMLMVGASNEIKKLPSAGRPKGKWLEVDSFESGKHSVTDMRCSLCGKYASIVLPHGNRYVYDFCPNCGAEMRGEDE